jgi:hypothetical protein
MRDRVPNKAVELTAKSVRSCVAPAFGSSSPLAFGIYWSKGGENQYYTA